MIAGLKGKTYEEKLRELDMDTLETRRNRQDLMQTYRLMNENSGAYKNDLFKMIQDGVHRNTRAGADPNNIKIPRVRLDIRKHSYPVRAAERWNRLDPETKNAKTINSFKHAIKFKC